MGRNIDSSSERMSVIGSDLAPACPEFYERSMKGV
jgi:hypothetical protein